VGATEALTTHGREEGREGGREGGGEDGKEGGEETFPHIYGGIPPRAVVKILHVLRGENGVFVGVEGMMEGEGRAAKG
jgi:hypothetical protein